MSVRDALAAVLAAGGQPLRVLDDDGEVRGLATLDAIGHVFDGSAALPDSAHAHPATGDQS
jgi:hypothetical protein